MDRKREIRKFWELRNIHTLVRGHSIVIVRLDSSLSDTGDRIASEATL